MTSGAPVKVGRRALAVRILVRPMNKFISLTCRAIALAVGLSVKTNAAAPVEATGGVASILFLDLTG